MMLLSVPARPIPLSRPVEVQSLPVGEGCPASAAASLTASAFLKSKFMLISFFFN